MRITLNTFQTKLLKELINEKLVATQNTGADTVTKLGTDLVRNQLSDLIAQIDKVPKPRKNAKKKPEAAVKSESNPWSEET
jgi:predicted transcriptional regulator